MKVSLKKHQDDEDDIIENDEEEVTDSDSEE